MSLLRHGKEELSIAIRETKSSALKLALITGTDNEGDHILLYKTINGFDTAISDADMKSIGDKLAGLYNYPNEDVLRIDTHVLKKAA